MAPLVSVRVTHESARVWVLGHRVHHGFAGLVLILAGLGACAHDWRDRREWWPRREPRPD